MRLTFLKPLYEVGGPFVSVYTDVSRDAEDAQKAIELRWSAAREHLAGQGADRGTLDAVERVLGAAEVRGERPEGQQGQVVFAADGAVAYTDLLPGPPRRAIARWGALPHAMPYLAQRGERIPYLQVVIDRLGADIVAVASDGVGRSAQVEGDDYPLHKPRGGERNNKRYQRAAEDQWQHNAVDVAREVERMAVRSGAEVIVVSGDRQASRMMVDHLRGGLHAAVVETESGARADGSASAALDAEQVRATRAKAAEHTERVLDTYRTRAGRPDDRSTAAGLAETVAALSRAQVGALLLNDDPRSVAELWAGPDPVHLATSADELRDLGVTEPVRDRADAAVVRALVGTDAELFTVPSERLKLSDGIGALLRYPTGDRRG